MRTTDKNPQTVTQLIDILRLLYAEFPLYDPKIVVDNVQLYDSTQVFSEFEKYYSFFFNYLENSLSVKQNFKDKWANYIGVNGKNLKRMYDALYSTYNPIENYSLKESGLDGIKNDVSTTTTTPTGTATVKDTETVAGLGSVGEGATSGTNTQVSSFTDRVDTTVTTPTNTQSGTFDGTTYTGYHEAREHHFERSGNIGTMTPADMIMKEYEIRKIDLLQGFVKGFINQYFFYVS